MLDYQLRSGVEIERVPYGEKGRKGENLISSWHAMYGHPHSTVRRIKDKGHGPRTLDHPDTPLSLGGLALMNVPSRRPFLSPRFAIKCENVENNLHCVPGLSPLQLR